MDFDLGVLWEALQQVAQSIIDGIGALLQQFLDLLAGMLGALIDGVLSLIVGMVEGLAAQLPDAGPLGLDSVSGILIGYAWLNSWLPVGELLTALGTYVGVMGALFAWRAIDWFIARLPLT